jgi:hypothetical protein
LVFGFMILTGYIDAGKNRRWPLYSHNADLFALCPVCVWSDSSWFLSRCPEFYFADKHWPEEGRNQAIGILVLGTLTFIPGSYVTVLAYRYLECLGQSKKSTKYCIEQNIRRIVWNYP